MKRGTRKNIDLGKQAATLEELAALSNESEAMVARASIRLCRELVVVLRDVGGDGIAVMRGGKVLMRIAGDWTDLVPVGPRPAA